MKIKFKKMQSNGNDFLITEDMNILKASIERLSDRKDGIGFDQLLLLDRSKEKWQVRVFNADGSEANNCFNGLRCLASYSSEKEQQIKIYKNIFIVIKDSEPSEQIATVLSKMPKGKQIENFYYVDIGNYHVIKESTDVFTEDLELLYENFKAKVEKFNLAPNYNLNIFQRAQDQINIRTYESGVGETKSCGSGTAATAYAISLETNEKKFKFSSQGGTSVILLESKNVLLSTAGYKLEFEGELSKSDFYA